MKTILLSLLVFSFIFVHAQEPKKKSKKELKAEKKAQQIMLTKALIDSKAYVFAATTVNPVKMRTVVLTSEYDVKIKNDSLFSYLPYYGRAYTASMGGDSPMIFKGPIIKYSTENGKKGNYIIKVKVANKSDRLDYSFNVSETGSATLNVISNNRQSISYYGDIEKITDSTKMKKKK
jgi:hypothetical protein